MPSRQREVLHRILRCRTAALGAQVFECPDCKRRQLRFHSCNDRHCPLCGQTDAQDWLRRQRRRLLLPVPYFLVTFTLPDPVRQWVRSHPQLGYDLLFAATSQAMQDLALNPKHLGAQLALLGVLHTWSRTLIYHPHIHYLIPAGGLSIDGRIWSHTGKKFFLPLTPLKRHFRNLFRQMLFKQAPELYEQIPGKVWKQEWNLNVEAVGSGEKALEYLARYIFKTATGNRRLERLPDGKVRWPYQDSKTRQWTHQDLEPQELIRRFLQHVLPRSYCRVRCFGWYHPAAKVRANRVRALLRQAPVLSEAERVTWQIDQSVLGKSGLGRTGDTPDGLEKKSSANPKAGGLTGASSIPIGGSPIGTGGSPVLPQAQTEPTETLHAPAPQCPRCHIPMVLLATWKPGQRLLLLRLPRPP